MRTFAFCLFFLLAEHAPQTVDATFLGKTRFLNNARAVVTHTFDDAHPDVVTCFDTLDKYGVKATSAVSTARPAMAPLWPRLRKAIDNGHEVGSHSRRHQCAWPDTEAVCRKFFDDSEVTGSRDDILANTQQTHVWTWVYPCGLCSGFEFVQQALAKAGYLVARNYPGEPEDKHNLPDLQDWAPNPLNAPYTQVVQKRGGIAKTGRTDPAELNAKFDEVYHKGGIYHFVSHPMWLDFGPESFYEQHLRHISRKQDIWYTPLGPLYAYRRTREATQVRRLGPGRFSVTHGLDPKVYPGSVTLEFRLPAANLPVSVLAGDRRLEDRPTGLTDRWNGEYYRTSGDRIYVTVRPGKVVSFQAPSR